MRNLSRITNYYSNLGARRDWRRACELARSVGVEPPEVNADSMTHRQLDKLTEKLLERAGKTWDDLSARTSVVC